MHMPEFKSLKVSGLDNGIALRVAPPSAWPEVKCDVPWAAIGEGVSHQVLRRPGRAKKEMAPPRSYLFCQQNGLSLMLDYHQFIIHR